jgi:hypothetical protein
MAGFQRPLTVVGKRSSGQVANVKFRTPEENNSGYNMLCGKMLHPFGCCFPVEGESNRGVGQRLFVLSRMLAFRYPNL